MIIKKGDEALLKQVISETKCRHSYAKTEYTFKGLFGDTKFMSRYCIKCERRPNAFLRSFLEINENLSVSNNLSKIWEM